jgi:signal transduction histidine kinase
LTLARLQLRSQPERLVTTVDEGEAVFDPALLARVLQNLVDNAVKYSPRSEPIRVELRRAGEGVRLVVEDRGRGVAPEDRERIFASWVRLEAPAVRAAPPSHGIGLAFCRHAVEAHGGRVFVEAAEPRGARFVVELPAAAQ